MPRSTLRDLLLLTLLCGLTYFTGLTAQGLVNWQEAQRAQVAREMQESGDWIVPREGGRPYLSKPPAMYWAQLALASLRGDRTSELDLRLIVALGGWLGVLATYVVTRRLLLPAVEQPEASAVAWAHEAAWWASLMLATGLLYVRSSRIGELDILLIAPTVVVIGAVYAAWRSHLLGRPTNRGAVALAALAACAAMLVKGPPGLFVAALASYGGIALGAAYSHTLKQGASPTLVPKSTLRYTAVAAGGLVLAGAAAALSQEPLLTLDGIIGLLAFTAIGAGLAATIVRLASWPRARALIVAYSRTHPALVLGMPLAVLASWLWLVSRRLGGWDAVRAAVASEAGDNVRPLVLGSPLNNLEAAGYGAGLGSLAAIIACVWLWRRRPALPTGWWMMAAWVMMGLAAMSLFGKGVPRYLTPVWPGLAIAGGSWLAWELQRIRHPWHLRGPALAGVLALAAGQAWWYGYARADPPVWLQRTLGPLPSPSPREFVGALLAADAGVDAARLATFEFETAQVDYYARASIPLYVDEKAGVTLERGEPRPLSQLAERLSSTDEPMTLLIRETQPPSLGGAPALERLSALFVVTPIPVPARFTIDKGRTEVIAVRVEAR